MDAASPPLPPDRANQAYVIVHALLAGGLWLPYKDVFQDSVNEPSEVGSEIPFIAFMITHPTHGRSLFDLGMRKHAKGWPPGVKAALDEYKVYQYCDEDIVDVLRKGGVDPTEITKIIYSHLHWDHVGDPTPFTDAEIVVGAEARVLLADAYPANPDSWIMALPAHMRAAFVDFTGGAPWGPFARAVDLYGDGTLYLVDTPGHLPGHVAAAARVAPGAFVFLAGDTCHNRACYDPGARLVSERNHRDVETARATVRRLVRLDREYPEAVVLLAHDQLRREEMPFFPKADLREWVEREVEKRKQAVRA